MKLLEHLVEKDYLYREAKEPATVYNISIQGIVNEVSPEEFGQLLALIWDCGLERLHSTKKGGISQKNRYVFNGYLAKEGTLIISYCYKVWRFRVV